MRLLDPCPQCKTRSITYNGLEWRCSHCTLPVSSPVEAERERIKGLMRRHVAEETVEMMLKEGEE